MFCDGVPLNDHECLWYSCWASEEVSSTPSLLLGGVFSALLVRSRVLTVLQQNMTIVHRASCFRWETDSFLWLWMARGREPWWSFLLSHVNSWGRRAEARPPSPWRVRHWVTEQRAHQTPHDRRGIQGQWPVVLAASVSPTSVRRWLDGWICDTKSDDRVRGGACQIPGDAWYEGMQSIWCDVSLSRRWITNSC